MLRSAPWTTALLLSAVCSLSACKQSRKEPAPAPDASSAPAPTGKAAAGKTPAGKAPSDRPEHQPIKGHRFPVGHKQIILPGKGISALRFGATRETIERHLDAPCDFVTPTRCVYTRQGIEFTLEDDKVTRMKIHRRDRRVEGAPADQDQYYGTFLGSIPPNISLGLHKHIVIEEYGEPRKKERIDPPGPDGQVERHYYDGVVIEYDKLSNGNTVSSAFEIYPSDTAPDAIRRAMDFKRQQDARKAAALKESNAKAALAAQKAQTAQKAQPPKSAP